MNYLGLEINIKNKPELDPDFIPMYKFNEAFLNTAKEPFNLAIERNDGQIHVINTFVHGTKTHREADNYYLDRLVKFELWQKGGFRIYINGNETLVNTLKHTYSPEGTRAFDADFMGNLCEKEFEIIHCDKIPEQHETKVKRGRNFDGCRIGFDAGGSDYKVAAVIDGQTVYSKETVWNPKQNEDPDYHFNGVMTAFRDAMEHMPRVDAIGISSAGLIGNNRILYAQLFQKVPREIFNKVGRDTYIRAVGEIGADIPFEVANDGDVAALAGSIGLNRNNILGLAMGTSFIGGFVDKAGNLSNWISELAFAPVDASPKAAMDDWTKDIGVGVSYFCQEAVIKLAKSTSIKLDGYDTPAKKLKAVQNLLDDDSEEAAAIFRSIGVYLGHTTPYYYSIFGADSILLLGRTVSGKGGDIILETATKVLKEEYPTLKVELLLPDEQTRRLGQSVAAASLPVICK